MKQLLHLVGRPPLYRGGESRNLRQALAEVVRGFDPADVRKPVIALGLGGIAVAAIVQSHHEEERKSEAEKDNPAKCEWLCGLIWDLLDDWEREDCEREDDYTDDLVEFLHEGLKGIRAEDDDRRIKVGKRVRTDLGVADVLIDDRLV